MPSRRCVELPVSSPRTMRTITAHHLTRLHCPCSLYLDLFAPSSERSATHPFLLHLQELGLIHEAAIASRLPHIPVPDGPASKRAHNTHQLMMRGAERIYQPVLSYPPLLGIPDFLERTEIPSALGPHSYRPVDVKIASSPHPEHDLNPVFRTEGSAGYRPLGVDRIAADG